MLFRDADGQVHRLTENAASRARLVRELTESVPALMTIVGIVLGPEVNRALRIVPESPLVERPVIDRPPVDRPLADRMADDALGDEVLTG
ncbi:hypothetical protein [Frondihabitans cladoniiphilus]|uniref:hypothetical protein n=1 Tax=Frondihabitans cladoniiphilus TaxID=715785 RepID=UPI0031E8BBB0